jgi:hypothetical protein
VKDERRRRIERELDLRETLLANLESSERAKRAAVSRCRLDDAPT